MAEPNIVMRQEKDWQEYEWVDYQEQQDSKEDIGDENDEKKEDKQKNDDTYIEENISPSKSFQIFAGRIYDESEPVTIQNNKDEINKQRKYEKEYISYNDNDIQTQSITNNKQFESPLQKYKRLKSEINEFSNELNKICKNIKDDSIDPTKNITDKLNNELSQLWKNIDDFKNNPKLNPFFNNNNNGILQTVKSDYLMKKLHEFQVNNINNNNNNDDSKKDNDNNNNNDNKAVFKLYHNGSINGKSFKMNEIAKRIEKLETIIGPTNDNNKVRNMNLSIQYLHKRLELLSDDNKLQTLSRKASQLRKELQEFQRKGNEKMENQITKTKEKRINQMFEMMERWDQAASQLPTIIQRLRTVKNLHEEAASTVTKVDELETEKKVIKELLDGNKKLLSDVQQSLKENAKTMQDNISVIEKRIDELQQKMQSI